MATKSFRYAAFALRILEKMLGSKFSISGIEKLPKRPVMFVANHFTRAETFFVPYLIYKHTGRQVRCLADSSLYHGALGKFLKSVGTISTKDPRRDNIILKDLIEGEYDWMIYPEGRMLKSKEIKNERGFISYTPHRVGPVRTGSAILALKSQIYRTDIEEAFAKNDTKLLKHYEDLLGTKYHNHFKDLKTQIVPLNITYYPLRPGKNIIQDLVAKLFKKVPKQLAEELEIEGNLLLGAEINISFGDPIDLSQYIKSIKKTIYQIPIIKNETKTNLILRYFKTRLTNEFMGEIYSDIKINLDHIFSSALSYVEESEIRINHLKRIIYLSAAMIEKSGKYRIHPSISKDNLFKIFLDEPHQEFDSVFELAKLQGLIVESENNQIVINKKLLEKKYDFHEIRRENSLQVVANEFSLLDLATSIVKKNAKIPYEKLGTKVFDEIYKSDLEVFERDYEKFFDAKFSKDRSVGSPFFLDSASKASVKIRNTGIVISHGYKSAPKEVEALAKFLNGFGFKVYATRLKGHGTAPINLKTVHFEDWYDSLQRGYAALHNLCPKIVIIGFSTGGLLGLLSAARKNLSRKKLSSIVVVNSAIKLLDIRAKMVPGINIWNEMLEKFDIKKGKFEYVDDVPENPEINYSRNYLKGVEQLGDLMEIYEKNLKNIDTKTLIIQADKDPVVAPISGKIIYDKISSKDKFLSELNFSNHVIINSERKEEVFEVIKKFLIEQ